MFWQRLPEHCLFKVNLSMTDAVQTTKTPDTPIRPPRPQAFQVPRQVIAYLLIAPPLLVMLLLIVYPAGLSIFNTLTVDTETGVQFSLQNYVNFFNAPDSVRNLQFTLQVTIVTVVLLFLGCFPIAYYLRFGIGRIVDAVQLLALFPMFVPGIITAYALIRFLGPNGWLDSFLVLTTGWEGYVTPYPKPPGIVIGLIWEGIPLTILILTAGLAQVSDELIESARDVGANRFQVFFRIILPQIQRPVLIVLTLNFLSVFGAFTMPLLLGPASPQMYGVYMQRLYSTSQYTQVQVAAVLMFLISAVVGLLYVRSVVSQRVEAGV